jgi:long-chain fatty acid transport protein
MSVQRFKASGLAAPLVILSQLFLGCMLFSLLISSGHAQVTGALGSGVSAAAAARGGAMAAAQDSSLDAMEDNPAALAAIRAPQLELSGIASFGSGSFQNSVDSHGTLHGASGALPYGSFAAPLGTSRLAAAIALTPEMLSRVDWHYLDPPGTAGVTYGEQTNKSKIVAVRSSAGIAAALGKKWSAGATVGLVYNTNTLNAPYIFQEQPQLAGLKVLLDLDTSGFGWNGSAGAQWQPSSRLRFGGAWKSGSRIQSHGNANGNAYALFSVLGITADPTFHYQAEVDNHLPQAVSGGLDWKQNRRLHWELEGNWTDWHRAFRVLPVKLKDGTNATINSVVGSNTFRDDIALHWHSQGAAHAGIESPLSKNWTFRAGYAFMSDPVPSKTLTPLTAAILRHSLATGAGWTRGKWIFDGAYQVQLPASQSVGQSALLAGEYDNSHLRVMEQSLTLTARINF